ncbi:hypothetical protein PHYSODRAFT_249619 [Phytophthora sojae]|uniref:DDE Tnp4 domain-containing protein n=1 Tax=Phytophthora sojae (strain P6497) TaxID=1094619 RepID=G4ZAC5_PHYSP|nr:hypothetical protein PHYSODRAFT_249619 [Phytophthora sojae]EGZ22640.1 hypothetical protein PHYSODRAFT_249619 [Phytophthora sojae]|eukprot:XP_009525357.1 hypothetical protein PHYSODRAFT_249619 [Phytophthora sojae]
MIDGDDGVVLLLYEAYKAHTERVRDARRNVHQLLLEEEWRVAMRSRHYLTTQCLDAPCASGWMTLYEYGTDINFLNATSLKRSAFDQLLCRFSCFYYMPPPSSRGRPPKLRYLHQLLGLVLTFYDGSMEQSSLCITFGVPPSTLSRTLRKAEEALARALNGYAPVRISWPSPSRQVELARMFNKRETLLTHTFGFIDGKNLRVQEPSNADLQNAMYNGWLHSVFVTGTMCFAADGCIIWSRHNCPGSWNDSDTSLKYLGKLTDLQYCPDGRMGVVSDSAFPCSTAMTGRILTPLKDGDIKKIEPSLRATARTLHNAITSIRQAAEWGMGSLQKFYSRLILPLPYDPNLRGMRIGNLFRLANYRVRTVGISEIKTTFSGAMEMPEQLAL